jgi:pimeloyl-ACP methyl ester carboxylesterase
MQPHSKPDTIVLIHGFWVTPRSWEKWITRFESRGYRVIAPAYPGFEVEVEALNQDPTPIEKVTVTEIIDHLVNVVKGLDKRPILMGHSAGGVFVQLLLDRGYGASGVVFNSAPTEGVLVAPLSQLKATFPVLAHPGKKSVGFTHAQWHYAFTNTFADDESQRLYKRYHIPASGEIFWESVLANVKPGRQETWVDYSNDNRAPLLFVSGGADNLMPPSVQRSNAKHYKSNTITEVKEYAGFAHLLPAQDGWEKIADEALDWAAQHARMPVGGTS